VFYSDCRSHESLIYEAEPLRSDLRRFNEERLFGFQSEGAKVTWYGLNFQVVIDTRTHRHSNAQEGDQQSKIERRTARVGLGERLTYMQPGPLSSTGITRLPGSYGPLRHPEWPGLSLAGVRLAGHAAQPPGLPPCLTLIADLD
jgi:hypothetical protein